VSDDGSAQVSTYRTASVVLAAITIALGLALIAATLAQGSGGLGILLGLLFVVAGAGRLYVARGGRR
jgi:hypothetical protein